MSLPDQSIWTGDTQSYQLLFEPHDHRSQKEGGPIGQPRRVKSSLTTRISEGRRLAGGSASAGMNRRDLARFR